MIGAKPWPAASRKSMVWIGLIVVAVIACVAIAFSANRRPVHVLNQQMANAEANQVARIAAVAKILDQARTPAKLSGWGYSEVRTEAGRGLIQTGSARYEPTPLGSQPP